jgi:acetyl esterase/lipase
MKAIIQRVAQLSNDLSEAWTRFMLRYLIPVSVQKWFARSGCFRLFADYGVSVLGLTMGLSKPSLLFELYQIRKNTQSFQYDQKKEMHFLEIIDLSAFPSNKTKDNTLPQPILIFVHGGAFGSGRLWQYCLPLKRMGEYMNASHVVLLGFPVFPFGTIIDQKDAIISALKYLQNESILKSFFQSTSGSAKSSSGLLSSSYLNNHQRSPIILAGHSTGAHLCAFALLDSLLKENHTLNVDLFLGMAGLYNISEHYAFETARGVQNASPLGQAGGETERNFQLSSPQYHLDVNREHFVALSKQQIANPRSNVSFPLFAMIHGENDIVVPYSASVKFAHSLEAAGLPVYCQTPKVLFISSCFPPAVLMSFLSFSFQDYEHISPLLHFVDSKDNETKQLITELLDYYYEYFHYKLAFNV